MLVYPGVTLLDATGPLQVFDEARSLGPPGRPRYEVLLASRDGGPVTSNTGVTIGTVSLAEAAKGPLDTLLIAGGRGVFDTTDDAALVDWVRRQAARADRVGSSCMGAFLTAAAGLLAGRRVVTHWRWCDELQRRYPGLSVERDPIFIRDGPIWSSAGVSAGIDMALAMVADDHGHGAALEVARSLVVYLKRPGGQSQFSAPLNAQAQDHLGAFDSLHDWMAANLDGDLRVERMAERAGMSPRSFARRYAAETGATPAKVVETMRVEEAQRLLEEGQLAIGQVAGRSGFGDDERMRRAFLRQLGIAPIEYRRRFGTCGTAART